MGYKPRPAGPRRHQESPASDRRGPPPEVVANALQKAREGDLLLLVDFYAEWCAPCRVLEEHVLTDPRVRPALERFLLVKVDTDENPGVATYYKIAVMPTLIVLEGQGRELKRFDGAITAGALAVGLTSLGETGRYEGPGSHGKEE